MLQRMLLGCTISFLFFTTLFAQNSSCDHQHPNTQIGDQIFESLNEEMADMLAKMAKNIEENKSKEGFTLPSTCFAPDTDASEVEKFYKAFHNLKVSLGIADAEKYNNTGRWSTTARSGGGLSQGDSTTLTWSYVPDGTEIANNCDGDPGDVSDFIAFFNGIYGPPTTPGDLTTAPWHQKFVDMFEDWSSKTGLTFVYEANDDGVPYASNVGANPGVVGTRGDIRIGGARIDGNGGVLACNYFPNVGDMIIDTDDNFYSNNSGLGVDNILAHEIGHGIGIRHVCPTNQTKLMEPFISTMFDGPQEDDYLAPTDTMEIILKGMMRSQMPWIWERLTQEWLFQNATASMMMEMQTSLASRAMPMRQHSMWLCFQPERLIWREHKTATDPVRQGTNFNAQAISDLQLNNWQGGSINSTSDVNGPGESESLAFTISDPTALEEYSVDQQVANDNVQIYDFRVVTISSVTNKVVGACDPGTDMYMVEFNANWANEGNITADISDHRRSGSAARLPEKFGRW